MNRYLKSLSVTAIIWLAALPAVVSCAPAVPQTPIQYSYQVVNVYPHDSTAFTQGLTFDNGILYEGTGRYGESSLRKVDLTTGKVLQVINLPKEYFGEGIAVYQDKIIQLTWQSYRGFIYDKQSFVLLDEFVYPTEGWGITYDGHRFIMSDGTSVLRFWDPATLRQTGQVEVTDNGTPVERLNELEFIDGKVYANVWQTDKIAIIEPASGRVEGWLDLTGLLQTQGTTGKVDVLNGIAYDAQSKKLYVTGKLWPWLFQIEMVPR
ncbi:MAG: glutaminyl-peptide cyclotransferase [Dehalococcoidales bacterium]|nr:glutaminyl-peptide cyclotransferase [Dehalococcoidales bacterium]